MSTRVLLLGSILFINCAMGAGLRGEDASPKGAAPALPSTRVRLPLAASSFWYRLASIDANGRARLTSTPHEDRFDRYRGSLSEGYYLGIVTRGESELPIGDRLVRVQILEIGPRLVLDVQLPQQAVGKITIGESLILIRPAETTTADLKQLPDALMVVEAGVDDGSPAVRLAKMGTSINNLKQIVLALHNYHDTYGQFPPAFIVGPNGKPWHSWRVLLLPFLEADATYKAYRFDEPWDGPHNIKLLDKMPAVYSDPLHGPNREHIAHYVAITGEGMAFSEKGGKLGEEKDDAKKPSGGRTIADFRDGTSRTLLVGSVGPDAKIPWLKPQDLEVTESLPRLGKPGSFAAPYEVEGIGRAGLFASADGVAWAIGEKIDKDLFRALLTIAGGEFVTPNQMTGVARARPVRQVPVIYVDKSADTPKATIVQEAVGPGF